jgi:hypothetical protein
MVGAAAFLAVVAHIACSGEANSFQPITYGAKPWLPPAGWDPEPPCSTGYYVAIDSCMGCSGISYALCTGDTFSQCVCGGPFTPGATCPQTLVCSVDDFPPQNWMEFTDYAGPGWAGLKSGSGASSGASASSGSGASAASGESSGASAGSGASANSGATAGSGAGSGANAGSGDGSDASAASGDDGG